MSIRVTIALATMLAGAAPALAADPAQPPLIERAKLFGNPSQAGGQISPDGKWLSWHAPRDGVLNIWVAPASDPSAARPLTALDSTNAPATRPAIFVRFLFILF